MGFQSSQTNNNVAPINNNNGGGNNNRNPNPTDAYINVSMPTRQGGTRKLVGIPLSVQKEFDRKILDFIADADDQEEALRQLASRLVLDFKRADGSNGAEPDFGPALAQETQAQA